MPQFLVTLQFSKGKGNSNTPLHVEAVITARNMEDAQQQLENGDVTKLHWIKYGHSRDEQFKPTRVGTESDFENFLSFASGWNVTRDRNGE